MGNSEDTDDTYDTDDRAERRRSLADRIVATGEALLQQPIQYSTDRASGLLQMWTRAVVRAALDLLRAARLLDSSGLGLLVRLPSRTLLDLYATFAYMRRDPQRAVEFVQAAILQTERHTELTAQLGIDVDEVLAVLREDQDFSDESGGDRDSVKAWKHHPFGLYANQRLREAGIEWQYDYVYGPDSEVVHMNARALKTYLDPDDRPSGSARLSHACETTLRVLFEADAVLGTGRNTEIARDTVTLALIEYPGENIAHVLAAIGGGGSVKLTSPD